MGKRPMLIVSGDEIAVLPLAGSLTDTVNVALPGFSGEAPLEITPVTVLRLRPRAASSVPPEVTVQDV